MSVAGLEPWTTGSVAKRSTYSIAPHKFNQFMIMLLLAFTFNRDYEIYGMCYYFIDLVKYPLVYNYIQVLTKFSFLCERRT